MDRSEMARRSAANHGVVTALDLAELGLHPRTVSRLVEQGEMRRLNNAALASSFAPPTWSQRCVAALAGSAGSLSHLSAGRVHGLTGCGECDEVHLVGALSAHHDLRGVVMHRCVALPPHHLTIRQGWRVTTVERTIIDLGSLLTRAQLSTCIQDAIVARLTVAQRLETTFLELATPGRPGIARVRAVLEELGASPVLESELEHRFRRLLRDAELPEPTWQPALPWATGDRGRVDGCYELQRLIVELDGRTFHARTDAFERDRRRDQDALAAGFRTIRFTHTQLRSERERVVALMATLLAP